MTYEEALKVIDNDLQAAIHDWDDPTDEYQREEAEALQMAKEALEKQIPTHIDIVAGYDICPRCGFNYGEDAIRRRLHSWCKPFCERCGQAIDWSEVK